MIYRSAAGAAAVERRYRELLRSWPVPYEAVTVPTGEGETFVVASGPPDAPPVVALQGSGANAAMWLRQIERLARHLRVYGALALLIARHFRPRTEPIPSFPDDALRGLTVPLLAGVGGQDALLDSYETERRLSANAPHATVHLLPESGHLLPDQTETMLPFLRSPAARDV